MGMDGMKNKCAVGIYKIEKKNVDAIDQRERRMEKMRLLLIHVVLLSVLGEVLGRNRCRRRKQILWT